MQPIFLDNLLIEVTRKPIRNLRMRVCPPDAAVRVSVPLHVTEAEIIRFVASRVDWIRHHRGKILARRTLYAPLCGERGAELQLWGRSYALDFVPGYAAQPQIAGSVLALSVSRPDDSASCLRALHKALRTMLERRMHDLVDIWAPALGVARPELRIRRMKTRWGTCNPTAARVWINAELVHRDPDCLEYVIVHELAHLIERGHTDRFRAILDRHLPDWKDCRRKLNGG